MRAISPTRVLMLTAVAAAAVTLAQTPESTAQPAGQGRAVVLLEFNDSKLNDVDALRKSARSVFFDAPDSVKWYYERQSRGKYRSIPAGDGVFGPFTLDMNASCDTGKIAAEAAKLLEGKVKYDDLAMIFPNQKAGCGFGGLGTVGGGGKTWYPAEYFGLATAAHEVGHNLGFGHQEREVCDPGKLNDCRKESYSFRTPMGGGGNQVGLSAPEMLHKGWLDPAEVDGRQTSHSVRLIPLHAPESAKGTRVVDIPVGDKDRVVVEYRVADKSTVDRVVRDGVDVYRVTDKQYARARLVDGSPGDAADHTDNALRQGHSLNDSRQKVAITVEKLTPEAADIRITIGEAAGQPSTSTPTPAPSAQPQSPATTDAAIAKVHEVDDTVPQPHAAAPNALADTGVDSSLGGLVVLSISLVVTGIVIVTGLALRRRRRT